MIIDKKAAQLRLIRLIFKTYYRANVMRSVCNDSPENFHHFVNQIAQREEEVILKACRNFDKPTVYQSVILNQMLYNLHRMYFLVSMLNKYDYAWRYATDYDVITRERI